jgi:ABC-2 type transport system permease protein
MIWSRRSLLMALLVGLPVALAILYRVLLAADIPNRAVPPLDLYGLVVAVYWVRNVLPLMALFHATSLIADEVEGRTLTYLLTRPLTRPSILTGKFAAYLATALGIALPSAVLTFFILMTERGWAGVAASVPDLFRDLGVITLTLLSYGALFTLLGVLLRRPVIPGLMFLFGWELMANLPGYLPRFTLTAWLRSLIHHRPAQEGLAELFGQVQPTGLSLTVLVASTVVFLAAAAWVFSQREYVLDQ